MKKTILILLLVSMLSVSNSNAQAPAIASFTPERGPVGTSVTLAGTNFNTTPKYNIVFFGATRALVTSATATRLTVNVPTGASLEPISVLDTITALTGYSSKPFVVTFGLGTVQNIDRGSFGARVAFPALPIPASIAIGDLDGDGKPDMVLANSGSSSVSVFRNISSSGSITNASFASPVTFTTASGPVSVAISDLNGNGKPELAVVCSSSISVLNNNSSVGSITSSSFSTKVDFSTIALSRSIVIGDIDVDGKPDLLVYNYESEIISILRNTTSRATISIGSFARRVNFLLDGPPRSIAIGDLDGDAKPDLAVGDFSDGTISVFHNTSSPGTINSGSFAAEVDFDAGGDSVVVKIGDVDGDGKLELIAGHCGPAKVSVFRNTATPGSISSSSFAAKVDFNPGNSSTSFMIISDLDGNGKPDLILGSYQGGMSVMRNTSVSGSINTSSFVSTARFQNNDYTRALAVNDLDGDSKPDLIATHSTDVIHELFILRNELNVSSLAPPAIASFTPASGPVGTPVTLAGTNFSTNPDSNIVFFGATRALVSAATSTQLTVTVPSGATYQSISVLNRVSSLATNTAAPFAVTFGTGQNIEPGSFETKVDFATGPSPSSVAIGDLDGDGKADMVVANASAHTVSVYRNISLTGSITAASFAGKVDFAAGITPMSVAIGDLDGDGKSDLAVANYNHGTACVLRNTSSPGSITSSSFASRVHFTTGSRPYSIAIGDLDSDGKADLAVTDIVNNTVAVLRNTSSPGNITASSFAPRITFATGLVPFSLAIGDLNNDRKPDIAIGNYSSGTVTILGNTTSTSSTYISFDYRLDSVVYAPKGVAIGDLDGDGKADLTVIGADGKISVFRNTSSLGGNSPVIFFAPKVQFVSGQAPYAIIISDLNGDGKADLTSVNANSNSVSVFRNTSTIGSITASSFAAKVDFAIGANSHSMAVADLDGDGKPDLVTASRNNNTVSILRNNLASASASTTSKFRNGYESESINSLNEVDGVKLYPNPGTSKVFIILPAADASSVAVTDLQGTVVKRGNYSSSEIEMDISNVSKGLYLIKIQQGNGVKILRLGIK